MSSNTKFKIYDIKRDQLAFTLSLVNNGFALIKVPSKNQQIIYDSFQYSLNNVFINKNDDKNLSCTNNERYIGYTSTKDIKQSIWFYTMLKDNKVELYPKIKSKQKLTNKFLKNSKPKYQKLYEDLFNNYHSLSMELLLIILNRICLNTESTKKCYYSLFPPISIINENKENEQSKQNKNDKLVHHKQKNTMFSHSTMAVIHYYADKKKQIQHDQDEETKHSEKLIVCDKHIDDGFITLISCNQSGLQVWDYHNNKDNNGDEEKWVDIDGILKENGYDNYMKNRLEVICVLRGGLLGRLVGKDGIYHRVLQSYDKDRLSKGFHLYPNIEHGVLDQSLIGINKNNDKISVFDTIEQGRRVAFSVNFDKQKNEK